MNHFDDDKLVNLLENVGRVISTAALRIGEMAIIAFDPLTRALTEFTRIFNMRVPEGWERHSDETDDEWQHRLSYDGHLDNPDARWEYQKLVWTYPIRRLQPVIDQLFTIKRKVQKWTTS